MAWFRKDHAPLQPPERESRVPEGLWIKCGSCKEILYRKELVQNLSVCNKCSFHFRISARERLGMLFDSAPEEFDFGLVSSDPLAFRDTKPYATRLKDGKDKTNSWDALVSAVGVMDGLRVVIAAMEYGFIGGSMGVVVGEKVTRAIERAEADRLPLIVVSCSGGARMMEGTLSLMQMAKISAALARLDDAGLPFLSVLTDPTTGGVTASFAMLGDLNIAEPGARRDGDLRLAALVLAGFGQHVVIGADAGLRLGLPRLGASPDPVELARQSALARLLLFAFNLRPLLLLLEPGRIAALVGNALPPIELERPLGDVFQEIAVVGDHDHGARIVAQMMFQPGHALGIEMVGRLVE